MLLKKMAFYMYSELSKVHIECTKPQGAFYLLIGFNNFKTQINNLGITTSENLSDYLFEAL